MRAECFQRLNSKQSRRIAKKSDPRATLDMTSEYGQTETLLEEWNQGEDNFLSIVRNNDSSLHASIKSFISVNWLYLISFLIYKAD